MYETIEYVIDDPIATITLNRPDRLNALTGQMLAELQQAVAAAEADERAVAILLTGAGRGFCAGADMARLQATSEGKTRSSVEWNSTDEKPGDFDMMGEDYRLGHVYLMATRKPIVAAINGPCAGLGFVIAMLCDIRFASDRAVFTTAFAQRGLVAEHGISWILPRLIGPAHAMDILLSGRKFDGAEAERLGVVNRTIEHDRLLEHTRNYLTALATRSAPRSLQTMKHQIYKHLDAPLGDAMRESQRLMEECLKRDDFKEGVASYVEKRAPRFERIKV
ncbi:MAG: enoyl-CoA hydratase-related protein [Vicinamibacterales bacterium]|jgi:enoyl-CoA hydratase/carnithine racemase|nr:enoyl-CoA hydratase-related protein [Vicinamibacterales bacterium]